MAGSRSGRAARRTDARWWRRTAPQRRSSRRRRLQRGQSLVIFAISLTMLMGLIGLAVDALRAYDLYGREHRAAEAAALVGVLYMPNFYNTPYTSGSGTTGSARSVALQMANKDGFGDGVTAPSSCTAPNTSMELTVCKADPSLGIQSDTALQVTITEPINIFFLSLVGINSITVSATSAADFLPGLDLGSTNPNDPRSYYWSDGGECNNKPVPPPSCSGGLHDFAAAINGPAELKQNGDPFVNCEEGPSYTTTPDPSAITGPLATNFYTGLVTNHPQFPTPNCGTANSNQQPGGYTGPQTAGTSHQGAYNYYIHAPTAPGVSVWVFNPSFIPSEPSSCNGYQLPDQFFQDITCTTFYSTYASLLDPLPGVPLTLGGIRFGDPRLYFNVTYTVYKVPVLYDRTGDVEYPCPPVSPQISCIPQKPYDAMGGNPCGAGNVYNLPTTPLGVGTCQSGASANQNGWAKVADDLGPTADDQQGIYRLAVESTAYNPWNDPLCGLFSCGWGVHAYGIKVCPDKFSDPSNVDNCWGSPPVVPAGTTIRPWNNMDIILLFANANLTDQIPLIDLPPIFAGRTVTISMFNPGPSHGHTGNSYFLLLPPATSDTGQANPPITVNYASWLRTTPFPGAPGTGLTSIYATARAGGSGPADNIYQGLWTTATVTLPPGYLGGQWWLNVSHDQGKDFNQFAISFSLAGGSPIHIIL